MLNRSKLSSSNLSGNKLSSSRLSKCLAVVLLLSIVAATTPVSAADFSSKSIVGSVNAVGLVDLRGAQIPEEATIFSGDRLSAGDGAYAKVLLVNGQKIEIGSNTVLKFAGQSGSAGNVDIELQSGAVAFSSARAIPVRITVGTYEITSTQPLTGNLGFLSNDFVDLKVLAGSASVRNLKTKQSYVVLKNQERMLGLKTLDMREPIAQVASNVPQPIPQTPGQTSGSSHTGLWIAVAAAGVGGIVALAVLTNKSTTATAATSAAQATQTVQSAMTTAATAQTVAAQVSTTVTQATNAINAAQNLPPATRTTLANQAGTISAAATASQQQVGQLQQQLQGLQTQLQNASGSQVTAIQNQINTVTQNLNSEVSNLNGLIGQLNSLIASAVNAGVPNVPPVTIQTIPPATVASVSVIP